MAFEVHNNNNNNNNNNIDKKNIQIEFIIFLKKRADRAIDQIS